MILLRLQKNISDSVQLQTLKKNESFHSMKSRLAPKYIKETSWKLRMCLAVIRWNLGENGLIKNKEFRTQKYVQILLKNS